MRRRKARREISREEEEGGREVVRMTERKEGNEEVDGEE